MKIISGGQTGADLAGLKVAKKLGFDTGGWAPKYWLTSKGPQKKLLESFNLVESTRAYKGRTAENVRDSNATIRLAVSFDTPGERCTMDAINSYKKPWLDINLLKPLGLRDALDFLVLVRPAILNIAGNTEGTNNYKVEELVTEYLMLLLTKYKRIYVK